MLSMQRLVLDERSHRMHRENRRAEMALPLSSTNDVETIDRTVKAETIYFEDKAAGKASMEPSREPLESTHKAQGGK
eukprot:SAG31_NODE_7354_length_1711_cov_11.980110_1_plen_77_part_00